MKILFYIVHPAQFYLFKNTIARLIEKENIVKIIIKDKDILKDLLEEYDLEYIKLFGKRRSQNFLYLVWEMINRDIKAILISLKFKPDLIIGTPFDVAIVGKLLSIPSVIINEDDAKVIPKAAKIGYPICDNILSPSCCDNGKWDYKTIKYESYHELAYLHPDNFIPDFSVLEKYLKTEQKYVLIRLAKLNAHHDVGKQGLSNDILKKLLKLIQENNRKILISSERVLPQFLEKYRISFKPSEMHHFMAFADLYIGDSQTMAAECAVLGTHSIRFNDFVGEIGYLNELEEKYHLTTGIKTCNPQQLLLVVENILNNKAENHCKFRDEMLNEKINFEKFLTCFIVNYPNSIKTLNTNPNYQYNFKIYQ